MHPDKFKFVLKLLSAGEHFPFISLEAVSNACSLCSCTNVSQILYPESVYLMIEVFKNHILFYIAFQWVEKFNDKGVGKVLGA